MGFLRSLYIHTRFFYYLSILVASFVLSYWLPWLYPISWLLTFLLLVLFFLDIYLLFKTPKGITASREVPKKLSNGDYNSLTVFVSSKYPFKTQVVIIDELPIQFQKRDFSYTAGLYKGEKKSFSYGLKPLERGNYLFGHLMVFASSPLRFIKRRYTFEKDRSAPVYPSIIQMQRYDFLAISNRLTEIGVKKIRRIGHTQEFEQIKEYVPGDDFRTINWKATAKKRQLMVNQYQDERSQPIYSLIDVGRVMKMPFNGLKLVDYAINATLAFSNVALKRKDKTGMLTFSNEVRNFVPAAQKITHLNTILETLYAIDTDFYETDFGRLYGQIKRKVTHRSLLLLYTNFEHISAVKRQLPYLLALNKQHLLVVIFFENTELEELVSTNAEDIQSIYHKTIAEKFILEKRRIQKELNNYGIQTILTKPEQLTLNTINKYLEIKARGLL